MNKILNSPLRDEIDRLLLSGKSVYELELWCKENGLVISATSIKRYAEMYLPEWINNKPLPVMPVSKNNDHNAETFTMEDTDNYFKISLPTVNSSQQFNQIIIDSLKETIINMVVIVNYKIGEYALGIMALPKDDILVLEKVVGIFNTVTGKHNEDRAGKNIFDIDEALERDEKRDSSAGQDLNGYLNSLKKSSDDD